MSVVNSEMRTLIKAMAVTCQTAQFVSLMPKPKDFVTRIVGDVVLLSSKVQQLSDDVNELLDDYANIPVNYLMTQITSLTNSMTGVVNRVNTYTQNAINQTLSVGENTLSTISEITGNAIDTVSSATQAIESLTGTITHSSSAILGQSDVAADIQAATEMIMEWTGNGFDVVQDSLTSPINTAIQSITDTKNKLMNNVNDTLTSATDSISDNYKWIEKLLTDLKDKMNKLSSKLDSGFRDVTGVSSISTGSSYVSDALTESGNDSASAQAVTAMSESLAYVLNNFSITKVIKAFAGVITESVIVKTGLDKLPPIDVESMLGKLTTSKPKTSEELYNELASTISDINEFTSSLKNNLYSDKNYNEFMSQFDDTLKEKRDSIRLSMRNNSSSKSNTELIETKSAIEEMREFKETVKNAKKAERLVSVVGKELSNLKKEMEYCSNSIKSDWNDMMNQYRNAINEIKEFFKNGGDGDMFIEDCCEAINQDCDDIKSLCSNIGSQLIGCAVKVVMPADVGPVVPNPIYKLASFWMDVKTIFNFIKNLITKVIDILNNINKLARIMLNGLNNLQEIVDQLMDIFGIKWFMDMIQDIIDMFGTKITDARTLLENSLSPVYYKDTDEYDNTLELIETVIDDSKTSLDSLLSKERFYKFDKSQLNSLKSGNDDKIDEIMDELDEKGDEIVAYRTPILKTSEQTSTVSEMADGTGEMSFDVTFAGWYYFHPDLANTNYSKLIKKIKGRLIKRASKKSNKTNGGVAMLNNKKVKKDSAYDAFYWYTYYTDDLEKDCYRNDANQGAVYIDSAVTTQNGSIIKLSDGRSVFVKDSRVKSGDYINVDGVKYKVE